MGANAITAIIRKGSSGSTPPAPGIILSAFVVSIIEAILSGSSASQQTTQSPGRVPTPSGEEAQPAYHLYSSVVRRDRTSHE